MNTLSLRQLLYGSKNKGFKSISFEIYYQIYYQKYYQIRPIQSLRLAILQSNWLALMK